MLLFAFGLLMGASIATTVNYYAATDPTAVRQAFGATALFVGGLGAGGYATRRDLSFLYRTAFWLLLVLIIAGIVLIFVRIPARLHRVRALRALASSGCTRSSTSTACAARARTKRSPWRPVSSSMS